MRHKENECVMDGCDDSGTERRLEDAVASLWCRKRGIENRPILFVACDDHYEVIAGALREDVDGYGKEVAYWSN